MDSFFSRRARVPEGTLVRVLDGESILLHLGSETYFGLDGSGTRFWERLTTSPTVGEACDRLAEEFEAAGETIRADMRKFVEQLERSGLIALSDPPAAE